MIVIMSNTIEINEETYVYAHVITITLLQHADSRHVTCSTCKML